MLKPTFFISTPREMRHGIHEVFHSGQSVGPPLYFLLRVRVSCNLYHTAPSGFQLTAHA